MLKRIIIIILSLFTLITIYPTVTFAQNKFRSIIQYGNLAGISLGSNYSFNSIFSVDVAVGTEFPRYIIWAPPYAGNTLNFGIKGNMSHHSGFYVSPGWYTGLFEIEAKLIVNRVKLLQMRKYNWQSAPTIAIGFEWPKNTKGKKVKLEIGSAFNIPTKFTKIRVFDEQNYVLEAKRSESSMGAIFPFFTFIVIK